MTWVAVLVVTVFGTAWVLTPAALERACNVHPELAVVGRGARLGADVPTAMHELAARPGLEALRAVAAGWRVASHTGGGLAAVLDSISRGLRHDEDARSELQA